jgi:phasin family protein
MINFTNTVSQSPALQSQLETQFSLLTDMTKGIYESMQRLNELNIQVAQTVMQETMSVARDVLQASNPNEALSVTAGQAQPAAEKVRAYQQHVQNILTETQANIAKTVGAHVPNVTRATEEAVREVAQNASEETAKATKRQKEAMEKLTTPIKGNGQSPTSNVVSKSMQ